MSEMREIKAEIIYQDINNNHLGHPTLKIIHFNDVYNIESGSIEPKAGAARFLSAINYLKSDQKAQSIVLFSGDAFSPSESKLKKNLKLDFLRFLFSKCNYKRITNGNLFEQIWYSQCMYW